MDDLTRLAIDLLIDADDLASDEDYVLMDDEERTLYLEAQGAILAPRLKAILDDFTAHRILSVAAWRQSYVPDHRAGR